MDACAKRDGLATFFGFPFHTLHTLHALHTLRSSPAPYISTHPVPIAMSTPPPASPAPGSADEGLAALERLRKRVEAAVAEIERLRAENAALAERVEALGAHGVVGESVPGLALGGDPDALREQVEGFIEAIDRMLAVPSASDDEPASEPASESAS
jgi:hypothetical protein